MKRSLIVIALAVVVIVAVLAIKLSKAETPEPHNSEEGTITLSGAWAIYPLAVKWAEEYQKIYPGIKIDISAGGAGKGMTDAITGLVDIGMVSREVYPEELAKGALPFAVAKDAVVAVVNTSNPAINDILSKGLKREAAQNIWITGEYKTWSQALQTASSAPIHVYTRSDACGAAETWANYFSKKQEDLLGSAVFGDPGLALAVQKDQLGIGYNNIGYAYDQSTGNPVEGIAVVPIDLNNNGVIDNEESFYGTLDELVQAIGEGLYPSPPARELYLVTNGKPTNQIVADFIRWILTDGQVFVLDAGFINLSDEKLALEADKL